VIIQQVKALKPLIYLYLFSGLVALLYFGVPWGTETVIVKATGNSNIQRLPKPVMRRPHNSKNIKTMIYTTPVQLSDGATVVLKSHSSFYKNQEIEVNRKYSYLKQEYQYSIDSTVVQEN